MTEMKNMSAITQIVDRFFYQNGLYFPPLNFFSKKNAVIVAISSPTGNEIQTPTGPRTRIFERMKLSGMVMTNCLNKEMTRESLPLPSASKVPE